MKNVLNSRAEGTLYVLHLQDFPLRIVLRHVVLRAIEYDKKKEMKGKGTDIEREENEGGIKRARFNFRS